MLIRRYTEPNEIDSRTGISVLAQRLSNTYRLKITAYTPDKTHVSIYGLTEEQYTYLIERYGKLINHSRTMSDYLIKFAPTTVWVARYSQHTNIALEQANNSSIVYPGNNAEINRLKKLAISDKTNFIYPDEFNNRWTITTFQIKES